MGSEHASSGCRITRCAGGSRRSHGCTASSSAMASRHDCPALWHRPRDCPAASGACLRRARHRARGAHASASSRGVPATTAGAWVSSQTVIARGQRASRLATFAERRPIQAATGTRAKVVKMRAGTAARSRFRRPRRQRAANSSAFSRDCPRARTSAEPPRRSRVALRHNSPVSVTRRCPSPARQP